MSFEAYPSEIVGLIGENGAGKSTLMKILSGAWPAGTYEANSSSKGCSARSAARKTRKTPAWAMIYQEAHLLQDISVMENILPGGCRTTAGAGGLEEARNRAVQLLDRLENDIPPNEDTRRLSASQQQMVAIAKALGARCQDPRVG